MTKQVETATIVGTITNAGNALVTVTASGMSNSPKALSVPVLLADTASDVAQSARYVLATDGDVAAFFQVSGTGANVVLTARVDAANDTTLNIASANDTCTGLTDQPTSTNTTAGAAVVTNGYCTIDEFKDFARIRYADKSGNTVQSTSTLDDGVIGLLIEAASRYIDKQAGRTFYASTQTRYYDVPLDTTGLLMFDVDFMSVTDVINGDGDSISSDDYILQPVNGTPYYGIIPIVPSLYWKPDGNGNTLGVVSVTGSCGGASTTPADITEACLLITKAAYNRRSGENMTSTSIITQGGIVITPEDVPAKAMDIISNNRRVGFG